MRKYIKLVDLIIVLIVLISSIFMTRIFARDVARYAIICVNGNEYGRYNIDKKQTIEVVTQYGRNVVVIDDKKVWVSETDCKDKVEVNAGSISKPGQSLVCLPNRLVVTIEGGTVTDATAF